MNAVGKTWAPAFLHGLFTHAMIRNGPAVAMDVMRQTTMYVITDCWVRDFDPDLPGRRGQRLRPFLVMACPGCYWCSN